MNVIVKNNIPMDKVRAVEALISTSAGTIPGDRAFGIDPSLQDLPINLFKAKYIAEISSKVKTYVSGVQVEEVLFEQDHTNGIIQPKVVINWI